MRKKVAVAGGGAAGFFFAVNLALIVPEAEITIFEKTSKILSKVKVSGGGRCNVTNAVSAPARLAENYPRGKTFLKKLYQDFSSDQTVEWFREQDVLLKTEHDNRIFPVTDSSQTIIDCFTNLAEKHGIRILMNSPVETIRAHDNKLLINESQLFDFVFVATGGNAKSEAYSWIRNASHQIISPLPSLFTFNVPHNPLKGLEGISVPLVLAKVEKTDLAATGAFLVTHWGVSGPAVLRLSSWGAEVLASAAYNFRVSLNFVPAVNPEELRKQLLDYKDNNRNKTIISNRLFDLPARLWERLVELSGIDKELKWNAVSKQQFNKLGENITNFHLDVQGKTTFKEEFVTCGGVSLEDVNAKTLESKHIENLYFGGEVLNIDGITGGFNFQAAWSTAWAAAQDVAVKILKDK